MKWFRRVALPPSVVKLLEELKAIATSPRLSYLAVKICNSRFKATKRSEGYAKLLEILEPLEGLKYRELDLEKEPAASE